MKIVLFLFIIFFQSCESSKDSPFVTIDSSEMIIDGIFNESSWKKAYRQILYDSIELFHFHNETDLFIGMQHLGAKRNVSTDLFLYNDHIEHLNFHASMKLGERTFKSKSWDPNINPFIGGTRNNGLQM